MSTPDTAFAPGRVEIHDVPVDEDMADLVEVFEVSVPTEKGSWCVVYVMHNLVRRTYEVEFSDELVDAAPQAITATVQLVLLAIRERRAGLTDEKGGRDGVR